MRRNWMLVCCLGVMACLVRSALAQEQERSDKGSAVVASAGPSTAKFPSRVMATAIRHMRVRAMLTDEDMRLILSYMTQ
ncbi:MAG: hypothetical protein DMG42_31400 [Acidobacteria bacterium]|nr:MAG: hypothetical protein DMG42_31400 [Acidobacteriota bacterium]